MHDWNRKLGNIEKANFALFMRRKGVDLNFSIRSETGVLIECWKTLALHHFYFLFILLWLNSDFRPLSNFHQNSQAGEDGSLRKVLFAFFCLLFISYSCLPTECSSYSSNSHSFPMKMTPQWIPLPSVHRMNRKKGHSKNIVCLYTHHRENDAERSVFVQSARNWWGL